MNKDFKAETSVVDPRLGQFFPKAILDIRDAEFVEFAKQIFIEKLDKIDDNFENLLWDGEFESELYPNYFPDIETEFARMCLEYLNNKYNIKGYKGFNIVSYSVDRYMTQPTDITIDYSSFANAYEFDFYTYFEFLVDNITEKQKQNIVEKAKDYLDENDENSIWFLESDNPEYAALLNELIEKYSEK